jgi:hypothetical protein
MRLRRCGTLTTPTCEASEKEREFGAGGLTGEVERLCLQISCDQLNAILVHAFVSYHVNSGSGANGHSGCNHRLNSSDTPAWVHQKLNQPGGGGQGGAPAAATDYSAAPLAGNWQNDPPF